MTQGPAPYRDCVRAQLRSIAGKAVAPDLSRLDSDTRTSIEIACNSAMTQGPAPYRDCVRRQVASISEKPSLDGGDREQPSPTIEPSSPPSTSMPTSRRSGLAAISD